MTSDPISKVEKSLNRLSQRTYKNATPAIFGGKYFWVFGWTKGGKMVVLGPFSDEMEANRELTALDDGEVFELETRDINRATRIIKLELIERGGDPDEALKRALHKKGLEREERKKDGTNR